MYTQPQLSPFVHREPQPGVEYDPHVQGRLISYSRPADGIDVHRFLQHAADGGTPALQHRPRFYWRDGRNGTVLAGVGVALSLMGWSEGRYRQIQRQAQTLFEQALFLDDRVPIAAPRLFGGFAFRQEFVPDRTWAAFHPAHFMLPHYQLVQQAGQSWLTINALLPPGEAPAARHAALQEALDACYQLLQASGEPASDPPSGHNDAQTAQRSYQMSYPMPYETWERIIEEAIQQFAQGPLRKVVLARVCEVRSRSLATRSRHSPIDVDAALTSLETRYPDCYTFLIEPRAHHAFLGATPELLATVEGACFQTMGLAGSAPRGTTPAADKQWADALFNSTKDRHEHALVVDALRERLMPITSDLDISGVPGIMQLNNIQHLYTPVQGRLRHPQGVLPLVEILHPTPAMGGWPRDLALDFIQTHEQTTRGWYAAPVGWIDHNLDGAFSVAIRSAVIQRNRAWLYAGAGIVADSEPAREWEETGWKFRPILDALGISNP